MPLRRDEVEEACRAWGRERARVMGRAVEDNPARQVGPVRCTLAAARLLQDGAGHDGGRVEQRWPEVYVGPALRVHRAFLVMPEHLREVFDTHYAMRGPLDGKAYRLHLSRRAYLERLGRARAVVRGVLEALERYAESVHQTG